MNTSSIYEDDEIIKLENRFNKFLTQLKKKELETTVFMNEIINFVTIDRIKAIFPKYRNEKVFNDIIKELCKALDKYNIESENIYEAVDKLLGKNSIPVMTIHKS